MSGGYIQIFKENYVCSTISNGTEINVLVTGEKFYLKSTGIVNTSCMKMVSQNRFIDVFGTFNIPIDKLKNIFKHANDRVLDAHIIDGTITIIGDNNEILYTAFLSNTLQNLKREIILTGSKPWLTLNGLSHF